MHKYMKFIFIHTIISIRFYIHTLMHICVRFWYIHHIRTVSIRKMCTYIYEVTLMHTFICYFHPNIGTYMIANTNANIIYKQFSWIQSYIYIHSLYSPILNMRAAFNTGIHTCTGRVYYILRSILICNFNLLIYINREFLSLRKCTHQFPTYTSKKTPFIQPFTLAYTFNGIQN